MKVALFEVCRTPEVFKPNSEAIVLSQCFTHLGIQFELHSNDGYWADKLKAGTVVDRDVIRQHMRDPSIDVVHFALHGVSEGLVLEWKGSIDARYPYDVLKGFEIKKMDMFRGKLVVSGACVSANLADAFVAAGATYVAPKEAIEWSNLGVFFQSFYSSLKAGSTAQAALASAIAGHPELASFRVYPQEGGQAMSAGASSDEEIADLQKQVELLQQQLALVNAQLALETAKQTQEAQLAKAVTEALTNQATSQFALGSEQAKLPLAELAGVKAALGDAQLPAGKSGTIQVVVGVAGTQLLRSKKPMLELLADVAGELGGQLSEGAVVVTEAQLDQAYQAKITLKLVDDQIKNLEKAIEPATPPTAVAQPAMAALPAFAAATYSLGFVLDTVNSLAKLFRVDRKVDIFAADTEALQMLGYMLEGKNPKFLANPAMMRDAFITEAETLLSKLNTLLVAVHKGDGVLTQLERIREDEAKTNPATSRLPAANVIAELKAQIEAAKLLLEGLHPSKKPDAFWTQVKGQLISSTLEGKDRLLLEAKAQALQITESRWWSGDQVSISGEVQVAFRILDPTGNVKAAGVILKASPPERTSFEKMPALSYPA